MSHSRAETITKDPYQSQETRTFAGETPPLQGLQGEGVTGARQTTSIKQLFEKRFLPIRLVPMLLITMTVSGSLPPIDVGLWRVLVLVLVLLLLLVVLRLRLQLRLRSY